MSRPETPKASTEVRVVPSTTRLDELDIDLNPELDSESESETFFQHKLCGDFSSVANEAKRDLIQVYQERHDETTDLSDLDEDEDPLEDEVNMVSQDIILHTKKKVLSEEQIVMINDIIEKQLMAIQRKYVQSFRLAQDYSDISKLGYQSLDALLEDVNQLVDFVWYTITILSDPARNFYQGQSLIRIAGDLVDYLVKFPLTPANLQQLLLLIRKLDRMFVIIDEFGGWDSTEKVRIGSVVERTRLSVMNSTLKQKIKVYRMEVAQIYELTIEKFQA